MVSSVETSIFSGSTALCTGDKDELSKLWGRQVKGQGHDDPTYGQKSTSGTLKVIHSSITFRKRSFLQRHSSRRFAIEDHLFFFNISNLFLETSLKVLEAVYENPWRCCLCDDDDDDDSSSNNDVSNSTVQNKLPSVVWCMHFSSWEMFISHCVVISQLLPKCLCYFLTCLCWFVAQFPNVHIQTFICRRAYSKAVLCCVNAVLERTWMKNPWIWILEQSGTLK